MAAQSEASGSLWRAYRGSGYLGNRCAHGPFVHTPSQGVAYNHANIFGNERCVMMEPKLSNGIKEVALGYGLEYKISDRRMREYLAPTYLILRHNHPELRFTAFISEVVKVRAEERKKRGPASKPKEYGIIASLEDISGGRVLNRSVGSTNNRVLWVDGRCDGDEIPQ